jgi:LysM repeat protein
MNLGFKIALIFLSIGQFLFAQPTNLKKHTVQKGETITQIAQKYKVTPYDIYRLNPDAQNGIQENAVLIIPSSIVASTSAQAKTHEVQPKETLYGISKQYNIAIEELEKLNPELKDGLKIGQIIQLSSFKASEIETLPSKPKRGKTHEVLPKETLYSIAKQYDTSVEVLEMLNPEVKSGLTIGYPLLINLGNAAKNVTAIADADKNYLNYEVKPKETLYGLTKLFRINSEELIRLNPELKDGVQEGMILKVPLNASLNTGQVREITDLQKTISKTERKELVLLLPFNISNIEGDSTLSTQARLKRDGFLNMTLDFYSGALMAIDSAKTLGLNFNVKIFDSQETKSSSAVETIIRENSLENVDAVIGPFYPQYVEKTAALLQNANVPVISPLRETTRSYPNLYQSLPPSDLVKNSMLDFIRNKKGNMIAFIDKKKSSSKQFIELNHKDVYVVPLNEKGGLVADSITPRLSRTKTNYFLLETASTSMIFNALTQCNVAKENGFDVALVALDMNDTFETTEVFQKVLKQKIIFPSVSNYKETPESIRFASQYRKLNNVNPNQYAIRGFDLVFDTLLRLSQNSSFEETVANSATEGVENKFDYEKKLASGYSNKGIYILYFDEDLTIKPVE